MTVQAGVERATLVAGELPSPSPWERSLITLLYALSGAVTLIRLVIVGYASEASDDHMVPLDFILSSGRLPRYGDCFQCYHPKLFYLIETDIIRGFAINDRLSRLMLGGLVDWASCVVVAAALAIFLRWQRVTPLARAIAFSLCIAAPGITLISVQPSNDGLVAGLSAVAIASFYRWSGTRGVIPLILSIVFGALAAASKGSGLVVFSGICAAILVQGFRFWRAHLAQATIVLTLGTLAGIFVSSAGYYVNYLDAGSPLASNIPRTAVAPFFTHSRLPSAGFNSIADGFLDFPILSALRVPYVGYADSVDAPQHRTNLWTMMHGNHLYSRFLLWPGSWHSTEAFTVGVGRLELALGLVPLGFMLLGFARRLRDHARLLVNHGAARMFADREAWLTGTALVIVVMVMKIAADYRWAASMKAFYAYPGLLGFAAALCGGLATLERPWLIKAVAVVAASLVSLHVLDAALLAADLSRSFNSRVAATGGYVNQIEDGEVDLVTTFAKAKVVSGKAHANPGFTGDLPFCDGALHDRTIGAGSPSEVDFLLEEHRPAATRFRVTVCNAAKNRHSGTGVHFQIFVDDRLLWDSGVVMAGAHRDADVSVAGAAKLRLVVVSLDKSPEDSPLWIDPRLR